MPRNGKEGILFSFIMSAIMIYVMAALNYGVRIGDVGAAAWSYALFNWPLAYVADMICDLCICTPSSRAIMNTFGAATDRAVWKGITVKFLMVALMTVFMTVFGAIMAFGFTFGAFTGFWRMFPYNFTIALPIQMLIVAPLSGKIVHAIGDAAAGAAGILLQFPFYAGIMGMMVAANDQGVSLAGVISQFFVDISNNVTFPMLSFLAAGIVNFFVPSGGGQWAVQGPIMMPAGAEMNIAAGRTAMAIAWGDQWTNMIQPFWALPALGIAKLSARDIMGYLVVILLFTGAVACLGFLGWALFF